MNTYEDKTKEDKKNSVANTVSQEQSRIEPTFQFEDNRPETIAQRKLQEMADNSSEVSQLKAFQKVPTRTNTSINEGVVQRMLVLDSGEVFVKLSDIMKNNVTYGLWQKHKNEQNFQDKLESSVRAYKFEAGLPETELEAPIEQIPDIEFEDEYLEPEVGSLENKKVYNVTIDEGAGFSGTNIEVLGTEGLSGCVAVIVRSENLNGEAVYFLAHVNSGKAGKHDEIAQEITNISQTISTLIQEQFELRDTAMEESRTNLTLVSNSGNDPLFIDMSTVLSQAGAKFSVAHASKVYIDLGTSELSTSQQWHLRTEGELGDERSSGYGGVNDKRGLNRIVVALVEGVRNGTVYPQKSELDYIKKEASDLGLSMDDPMFSEFVTMSDIFATFGVM